MRDVSELQPLFDHIKRLRSFATTVKLDGRKVSVQVNFDPSLAGHCLRFYADGVLQATLYDDGERVNHNYASPEYSERFTQAVEKTLRKAMPS